MWMASWASSSDRTLVSAGLIEGVYIDISVDPSEEVCQLTAEFQVDMGSIDSLGWAPTAT